MGRWANIDLLLGQCRRLWANSKPTLGQRLMFAGLLSHPVNSVDFDKVLGGGGE